VPCQVPVKLWANNAPPGSIAKAITHSSNFFMAAYFTSSSGPQEVLAAQTPL
jgi:hypothetical protein